MGCQNSKGTTVTPTTHIPRNNDDGTTNDEVDPNEDKTLFGLHKAKTMAEVKELEDNMGGMLKDNYVMGPYAASAIFYEVRKVFN